MVGFDFLEIDRSSACDDVAVIAGKQHDVVVGNDRHGLGILLVLHLRHERQERVLDDMTWSACGSHVEVRRYTEHTSEPDLVSHANQERKVKGDPSTHSASCTDDAGKTASNPGRACTGK